MKLEAVLNYLNLDLIPVIGGLVFVIATCLMVKIIYDTNKALTIGRRKPPGPTGLPIVGYLPFLGKEPYKKFSKMKEKYGSIISIYLGRKYTIILNDYNVVKQVLSHPAALNRAPGVMDYLDRHGIMNTNGEVWKEQRKYCMTTSQELGLGRGHWEDLIVEEISIFTEKLQRCKGKPADISNDLMTSLISNIITLLIGRRLRRDIEPEKIELQVNYLKTIMAFINPFSIASAVPGLRKFCEVFKIAGYDGAAQSIQDFSSFLVEEINRHKTSPEFKNVQDFINSYLNKISELSESKNKKHYFSEQELLGNLISLFLGATDTISSSLGWLFRLMSAHKGIQEKVYKELTEALGKDGRAKYDERDKIPYTFAVLMECQRYASISPMSANRIASEDIDVNRYFIPKGAEIIANLWALHRDPNYWDEPDTFRPERFLTDDGTKIIKQPQSYAPFSVGRRNCPGESIAWMEILLYFSETIKKFEISTPYGVEPEFQIVHGLVEHLSSQPLCFKERKI